MSAILKYRFNLKDSDKQNVTGFRISKRFVSVSPGVILAEKVTTSQVVRGCREEKVPWEV